MANEFKIKKGLIVTGASGGTVVDIQGSQGQLFSVTDDLSGSIFAVSDISGVPILDVNSSGTSYFDGSLGIGTVNPSRQLEVVSSSGIVAVLTSTTGGSYISMEDSATTSDSEVRFGAIGDNAIIKSGGTTALSLDASQNATFAGQITTTQNQITTNIGTTSAIRLKPTSTANTTGKSSIFLGTSPVDNYGISLRGARLGSDGTPTFELATHSNSANGTVALSIDNSQNATFTGTVTASTFLGDLNGTINTATIGVTQTAGNNSTLIATTAYADAAAAAVPIGDYLPLAGGTLTGGLIGTSANFGEGVKSTDGFFNNVEGIRLLYPNGGSNNALGNSGTTGALKITLPQGWTSTMMRMTIKVYEYSESKSFTINCGGYNHSDSSAWINEFAYIESQSEVDRNFTVRFGYDSNNKCCIYIGELTSVWSYPKVFVTDFEAGFNNTVASNWQDGWVISMETTAFENVSQIRTNCQINNWKRNGQDVYYGSGTGNVGIGTTSPDSIVDIVGNNPILTIRDSDTSTSTATSTIRFAESNANDTLGNYWDVGYSPVNLLNFDFNSSTKMTITSTGNVGIGTTSPGRQLELRGQGVIRLNTISSGDPGLDFNTSDVNDMQIRYRSSTDVLAIYSYGTSSDVFTIKKSDGNVGIGTTSPGANLEINDASAPKIRFGRGSSYYWDIGHTTSDFQIQSQTGGTIMHLEYTGNVGIGTTSPDEMLHIENSSGANIILNSNTGAVNNGIYMSEGTSSTPTQNGAYFYYDSSANAVKLDTGTSSLSTKLTVSRDSGNVGIGTTSPANTLNVNGDIGYIGVIGQGSIYGNTGNSSYADMQLYNPSTGYSTFNNQSYGYYFNTSGGTKLTILNNGNVGIGTTSPSEKLEVNGNISIGTSSQWIGKDNESNSFGFNASTGQYINSTASISLAIDSNNSDSDTRFFRIIKNSYGYGNGSELFRVNENGNVGIGTTSPSKKLEVNGNFKLGTNAYIEYGGVYPYTITTANTAAVGNLVFSAGLGSAAYESRIDLQGTNTAGVAGITLSTAATARMVVTADGDVGIGTTTPNAKLDIQGTQGQLFSVTDDLSGDIFSVADISGVPIFDINSNGLSTFDGEVDIKTSFGGSNFYQLGVGTTSSGSIYAEGRIFCGGTTFTNGEAIFNDKVGIGTTSPENKLHVQQSALYTGIQTTAGIRVKSDGGSAIGNYHGTIALSRGTGSVAISAVQEATDSDVMGMAFFTHPSATGGDAAVEQMRIDQNGNVGIGTTSPVVKLDVEAGSTGDAQGDSTTAAIFRAGRQNVWFQNQRTAAGTDWNNNTFKIIANIDSTSHQSINFVNDASYNEHIDIYTGNQVFNTRFNANGNVGIGTTSPGAKLEVKGSGTSPIVYFGNGVDNAPNRQLAFSGGSSGLVWDLDATGASSVGGQLTLSTNGTERMRINSSGNVGIGTTSPSDKLHVNGTVRSQAPATSDWALLGYNSAGSAASGLWFDNGDGELLLRDDSGNLNVRLRSDTSSYINGGNLGLGTTSPAQKLTVNSGRMLVSNTTTPIYIKAGSTYKSWVHHIGGSDGYIFAPSTADNGETWDWANQTKLGANGVVTAKNFQLSSDERFKNNIKDIKDIKVEAAFKSFEMESSPGEKRYGVVAQELEKTNPELVETDHEGFKSVKYIDLLIAKIAELEARLEKLEK